MSATVSDGALDIRTELKAAGYGGCTAAFVLYGRFSGITLNGRKRRAKPVAVRLAGTTLRLRAFGD